MSGFGSTALSIISIADKLLDLFLKKKSPEEKDKEAISEIGSAIKKAKDDKDPTDISRIINK
jgi:hypothetical protein